MVGRRGGTPRSRYPGGGVNNDGAPLHQPRPHERHQREDAGGGITACIADDFCRTDGFPLPFRQPVNPRRIAMFVRQAVPLRINRRIGKAVIRAQINDAQRQMCHRLAQFHRMTVRQGDKQHLRIGGDVRSGSHRLQHQRTASAQMRIDRSGHLPGMAFRGNVDDFCLRVSGENTQQFRTNIAGSTNNADFHDFFLLFSDDL